MEFLTVGVELIEADRPGARRIQETLEFFRFQRTELPRQVKRWHDYRRHKLGRGNRADDRR